MNAKPERSRRATTLILGRLESAVGIEAVRVRNISTSGAMVELAARLAPGDEVTLETECSGTTAAEIVWSENGRAGLKFKSDVVLNMSGERFKPMMVTPKPIVHKRPGLRMSLRHDDRIREDEWY